MKLIIKGSTITMVEGGTLIQNDKTPCSVEFVFLGCWEDFPTKTVLFKAGNAAEVSVSLTENKCLIPDACLKEGGVFLKACVKGSGSGEGISTGWYTLGRVLYDASIDTSGGGGYDPGAYDELKKDIGEMSELQTESKDLVGAINELKEEIDSGGGGTDSGTVSDADVDQMLDEVFGPLS